MKDTKFKMIVTFEKQSMESGQDASLEPGKLFFLKKLRAKANNSKIFWLSGGYGCIHYILCMLKMFHDKKIVYCPPDYIYLSPSLTVH